MRKSILFVTNRRPESQTQTLTNFLYPWKSSPYNVKFWWVVTVTVVTVIFSRVSNFLFLYITIYILISYIVLIGVSHPRFLTVTTVTVTTNQIEYEISYPLIWPLKDKSLLLPIMQKHHSFPICKQKHGRTLKIWRERHFCSCLLLAIEVIWVNLQRKLSKIARRIE